MGADQGATAKRVRELTQSLALLRAILATTDDGILVTDPAGNIVDYNEHFVSLWRLSSDLLAAKDHRQVVAQTSKQLVDPAGFLKRVEQIYTSDETSVDELKLQDGRVIERISRPQFFEGSPIGRVWSFRDLSERRHVEKMSFRLAAIVESSDDAIISKSLDGIIETWNASAERIFGYKAEEVIGKSIMILIPPDRAAEEPKIIARLKQGKRIEQFETVRVRKDGKRIDISLTVSPVRDASGAIIGASKVVREISDRLRSEELQQHLAAIVESSEDAIISKDLNSIIRTWNKGAERMFGYTAEEAIGQSITILFPPGREDEEIAILDRLRRGERVEHYESERLRKDGRVLSVSLTVSPIRDRAGNITGAAKIARDVTERKRAEDMLRRSEAELRAVAKEREALLEAERAARAEAERVSIMKDEFLATLSHELRTPLTAILGWAQVLTVGGFELDDMKQGIETIERNARVQTQLIDDLLDMSRIVSGKLRLDVQWTELASVVDAAVESVRPSADAKGIRLRKIIDPHAGPVLGDPTRLQQVVWNLLSNAIKFTPKEGNVDVTLERVNSHVEITVGDSGIGIKPEFLPLVFERFRQADSSTTRSFGGLGLGLSIVKKLVELHGGTVVAKSPGEGQGSTFTVMLPLAPVRGGAQREHPATSRAQLLDCAQLNLEGIKVLIVEDEPDARALISRVLNQCHADVAVAGSAAEAIERFRQFRPHVLVSDIGMPEVDGYEFIREIRKLSPEEGGKTPAIALTAFARTEDRTRAMLAGYQVHMAKPIEPQELAASVGSLAAWRDSAS